MKKLVTIAAMLAVSSTTLASQSLLALQCDIEASNGVGYHITTQGKELQLMYGQKGATGDMIPFSLVQSDETPKMSSSRYISHNDRMQLDIVQKSKFSEPTVTLKEFKEGVVFSDDCIDRNNLSLNRLVANNQSVNNYILKIQKEQDYQITCTLTEELTQLNPTSKKFQVEYYCETTQGHSFGSIQIKGIYLESSPYRPAQIAVTNMNLYRGE